MGLRGPARKAVDAGETRTRNRTKTEQKRDKKRENTLKSQESATEPSQDPAIDLWQIEKPNYLLKEAKELWDELIPKLQQAGIVTALDENLLADYCQAQGRAIKHERYLAKNGDYIENSNRSKTVRPEVKLAAEARKEAHKIAEKLGLTPRARQAMGIVLRKPRGTTRDGAQSTTNESNIPAHLQGIFQRR